MLEKASEWYSQNRDTVLKMVCIIGAIACFGFAALQIVKLFVK